MTHGDDEASPFVIHDVTKEAKGRIVTHGDDEASPFVIHDVTKEAKGRAKWVNDHIWDLNRMQKQPEEVEVCPGEQCMEPYECWYYEYCHGESAE